MKRAIDDYTTQISACPRDAKAYTKRADAYYCEGNVEKAIADYADAIRLDPSDPYPYSRSAWIWCTHPNGKIRDGQSALKSAKMACELTNLSQPDFISTLAAAYAEIGEYDAAINWLQIAIDMLHKGSDAKNMSVLFNYTGGENL